MSTALVPKLPRDQVPADKCLCDFCSAKCCKYFALPIDEPKKFNEFEYLRWYLMHDKATVFTEEGSWYLLVHTTCQHLRPDNMCGIYETRPQICREYSTNNCEYEDDWVYDRYFETPEQVWEYTEALLGPNSGDIRSPKPALLPVIG